MKFWNCSGTTSKSNEPCCFSLRLKLGRDQSICQPQPFRCWRPFPRSATTHLSSLERNKNSTSSICANLGCASAKSRDIRDVRIHDLRDSFASVGVSSGASQPIIGKLLDHAKSSTTEKHSHLAADPVRAVNEAMGNQIAAMLSGQKGDIVKLPVVMGS